jgi:hypothetical protein
MLPRVKRSPALRAERNPWRAIAQASLPQRGRGDVRFLINSNVFVALLIALNGMDVEAGATWILCYV